MKNMKKLAYITVGSVFTLILTFTFITWADSSSQQTSGTAQKAPVLSGTSSEKVDGQLSFLDKENKKLILFDGAQKHEYQINSNTTIYIGQNTGTLDQLKVGDQVQAVLNSAGELRYIIEQKSSSAASAQGTSGSQPAAVQATVQPAASKPLQQTVQPAKSVSVPFQQFHFNFDQNGVKINITWDKNQGHVEVKTPEGHWDLKGKEAADFIASRFGAFKIPAGTDREEIARQIALLLNLKLNSSSSYTVEVKSDGKEAKINHHPPKAKPNPGHGRGEKHGKGHEED